MAQATGRRPAARPGDAKKQIARPLTAEALADYGELKTPAPDGPFNPTRAWTQSYRIWMTGGPWDNYQGYVQLSRSETRDRGFELTVSEILIMPRTRAVHQTEVTAQCADDTLATPIRWKLLSRVLDVKTGEEFADARVEQQGMANRDNIAIVSNGRKRTRNIAGPWTWNWSLFEATQRLPKADALGGPFVIFDDLDVLKPNQRLLRRRPSKLAFGGSNVDVVRYDQIGSSLLPTCYYVDTAGRLLLVHTELRAYILDPGVEKLHQDKMKWIARKELK